MSGETPGLPVWALTARAQADERWTWLTRVADAGADVARAAA